MTSPFPVPDPQAGNASLAWAQRITDGVNELDGRTTNIPKATLRRTSAFTHSTSASWLQLTFHAGSQSQAGMIDVAAGTMTIPVTGTYLTMLKYNHSLSGAGSARGGLVNVNSTDAATNIRMQQMEPVQPIGPVSSSFSVPIEFTAGEVVRAFVYQNSGGSLVSSTYFPQLSLRLLPD